MSPKGVLIQEEDVIFNDLQKEVKKPIYAARDKATWILEATWRLVYQRTALRRRYTTG